MEDHDEGADLRREGGAVMAAAKTAKPKPVTLTIVARRPDCELALDDLAPPVDGEDDLPIEEAMAKLAARSDPDAHLVRRAASCADVFNIVDKVRTEQRQRLALIQIIGHGRIGELALGSMWLEKWNQPPPKPGVYAINGDLNLTGVLTGMVSEPTEVRLLGCTSGAPGAPPDLLADGPTFLFTLAQMWRTKVSAPCNTFNADDFDERGLFARVNELTVANRLRIRVPPPSLRHQASQRISGETEAVTFVALRAAPRLAREASALPPASLDALSACRFRRFDGKDVFAAPELVFDIAHGDEAYRGEVICDGAMLRLRGAGRTLLLTSDADAQQKLRATAAQLFADTARKFR